MLMRSLLQYSLLLYTFVKASPDSDLIGRNMQRVSVKTRAAFIIKVFVFDCTVYGLTVWVSYIVF